MSRERDEYLASEARRALADDGLARAWREGDDADAARERRDALAAGTRWRGRAAAVLAVAASAFVMLRLFASSPPDLAELLARVDAGEGPTARDSRWLEETLPSVEARALLTQPWDDAEVLDALAAELPDPPRAGAPAPVRLLEPRGGVATPSPTFTIEVPSEDDEVSLVLSVRVAGGETRELPWIAGPGRQSLTPDLERLDVGSEVAWRVGRGADDRSGVPALFVVRSAAELARARDAVAGETSEARVLRAAALLAAGFERAALDELDELVGEVAPAIERRADFLRAVAAARRGDVEEFEGLR